MRGKKPTADVGLTTAVRGSSKNYSTTSFGSPVYEEAVLNIFESLERTKQKILMHRVDQQGKNFGSNVVLIFPIIGHVRMMIVMRNSNLLPLLRPMNPFGF